VFISIWGLKAKRKGGGKEERKGGKENLLLLAFNQHIETNMR